MPMVNLHLETASLIVLSQYTTFPRVNILVKIWHGGLFCLPDLESNKLLDLQFDGKKPTVFSLLPKPQGYNTSIRTTRVWQKAGESG